MTEIVITGSHTTPAQALVELFPKDWQVSHLGDATGPKLKRYDLFGSLGSLVKLPGLVFKFRRKLQLIKADLVVSFGGFASLPVCLAAKILKLPILLHEQTFGAGLAAKAEAVLADKVAISWDSSRCDFPRGKTVLTGLPLRRKILEIRRDPKQVLYISGGHQGSLAINAAVAPILPQLVKQFTVYHAYGKQVPFTKHKNYLAKTYFGVDELAKIYSRARLVISRAGINTITELGYLKIPAVLIPLPYTQKGEQETNAGWLAKLGLAVVLPQPELTPANLVSAINQALNLKPEAGDFPKNQINQAAKNLLGLCLNLRRR